MFKLKKLHKHFTQFQCLTLDYSLAFLTHSSSPTNQTSHSSPDPPLSAPLITSSTVTNSQIGSQVCDPTLVWPKHKSHPAVLRFVTQCKCHSPLSRQLASQVRIWVSRFVGFWFWNLDSWSNAKIFGWFFFGSGFVGCSFCGGYGDFGGGLSWSAASNSHGSLSWLAHWSLITSIGS